MKLKDRKEELVSHINSKLTFVEMEKNLLEIISSLLDDHIYSNEDAAEDLMEVLALIRWERETVRNKMGKIIDIRE